MPQLPPLTPDQREKALEKALLVRRERAEVRGRLKKGKITVSAVLEDAAQNETIAKMRVFSLLTAVPGVGKVRAEQIMDRLGIARNRNVRGLGPNQRADLEQEFDPA
jgi:hypothetical protein